MEPLISVIIPVYKVECYLNKCVSSVVNQKYRNLEIILVDDGSPDLCPRMCDEWAMKDNRIRVIHKENAGLGFARNSGIEACNGEFIIFVDSDDYLPWNAVQSLYDRIIVDGSDMAVGKHVDIYEDGKENDIFCHWMKDSIVSPLDVFKYLGEKQYISVIACAKLYRRSLFEKIRYPSIKCSEDLWVFPQIVDKCKTISVVDAVVYYYYQRTGSIMHTKDQEQIFDDTHSKLRTIRFLLDRKIYKSARRWYSFVIDNELRLTNRKAFKLLNRNYLENRHLWILLKGMPLKYRVKWLVLQFPFSNVLFRIWLNIKDRGNHE